MVKKYATRAAAHHEVNRAEFLRWKNKILNLEWKVAAIIRLLKITRRELKGRRTTAK